MVNNPAQRRIEIINCKLGVCQSHVRIILESPEALHDEAPLPVKQIKEALKVRDALAHSSSMPLGKNSVLLNTLSADIAATHLVN